MENERALLTKQIETLQNLTKALSVQLEQT